MGEGTEERTGCWKGGLRETAEKSCGESSMADPSRHRSGVRRHRQVGGTSPSLEESVPAPDTLIPTPKDVIVCLIHMRVRNDYIASLDHHAVRLVPLRE